MFRRQGHDPDAHGVYIGHIWKQIIPVLWRNQADQSFGFVGEKPKPITGQCCQNTDLAIFHKAQVRRVVDGQAGFADVQLQGGQRGFGKDDLQRFVHRDLFSAK